MVFDEVVDLSHESTGHLTQVMINPDERDFGLIAELYQQLKKNYDDRKDYWAAGDFHYAEMEMKRLSSPRASWLARWWHKNLGLAALYKFASQYGESYWRPLLWLTIIILLFAALYAGVGLRYYFVPQPSPLPLASPIAPGEFPPSEEGVPQGREAQRNVQSQPVEAGTAEVPRILVLTYRAPYRPDAWGPPHVWRARVALFGNSFLTALSVAALQKELIYEPVYPWGKLFSLLETLLTSTLFALFVLALRRRFRR